MGTTCSRLTSEIVFSDTTLFEPFQNPENLTVCPSSRHGCVANTIELACLLENGPPTDIVLCNGSLIFKDSDVYFDVTGVESITCEEGASVCLVVVNDESDNCPVWGQTDELSLTVDGVTYLPFLIEDDADFELNFDPETFIAEFGNGAVEFPFYQFVTNTGPDEPFNFAVEGEFCADESTGKGSKGKGSKGKGSRLCKSGGKGGKGGKGSSDRRRVEHVEGLNRDVRETYECSKVEQNLAAIIRKDENMVLDMFSKMDVDGDGLISVHEAVAYGDPKTSKCAPDLV